MKKLPDRFICEKCSYISTKDYLVCPACDNGMVREYSSDESKESQKWQTLTYGYKKWEKIGIIEKEEFEQIEKELKNA